MLEKGELERVEFGCCSCTVVNVSISFGISFGVIIIITRHIDRYSCLDTNAPFLVVLYSGPLYVSIDEIQQAVASCTCHCFYNIDVQYIKVLNSTIIYKTFHVMQTTYNI